VKIQSVRAEIHGPCGHGVCLGCIYHCVYVAVCVAACVAVRVAVCVAVCAVQGNYMRDICICSSVPRLSSRQMSRMNEACQS